MIKGDDLKDPVMQPDRSIVEKNDGTIEGVVVFKAEKNLRSSGNRWWGRDRVYDKFPEINDEHPDDDRLQCYNLAFTNNPNGIITCQASYFGVIPSQYQVSYTGGSNSEPIETHPNFAYLAGTVSNPKPNAKWDTETGEFISFTDGEYQGLEYYLTPSNTLSITYWLDRTPNLKALMSVYGNPLTLATEDDEGRENTSGIVLPNVKSWLLVSIPTRKVGNFYQVTEQWIGSGNLKGWNKLIYPNQQAVEEEEDA